MICDMGLFFSLCYLINKYLCIWILFPNIYRRRHIIFVARDLSEYLQGQVYCLSVGCYRG